MKIKLTNNQKKKLKAFFRNTKAQIRGVDFALALLIFVIAFSQVIIVLSNLLIPSLVQMETYSQEQELNKLYSNIFFSQGSPTDWGTRSTEGLLDFKLGLMGTNSELDFTKINRLTSDISDYWALNYLDVKVSYGLVRDFAVSIYSPITIEIESFTAAFGIITIEGVVKELLTPIANAEVWALSIDENNNVATNYTTTQNISGDIKFQAVINADDTNHYTIVVFAQVGEIYQDYTVIRLVKQDLGLEYELADFNFRPFVYENTDLQTSAIDFNYERESLSDEATGIVVFPFSGLGVTHYSQSLVATTLISEPIYQGTELPIPANGLAVLVINDRADSTYTAGYMGIPMFQDDENGNIFAHSSFADQTTYISETRTMLVRNILLKCQIWYW